MLSTRWIMTRYLTPVLVVTAAGSLFAQGEPPICQTVSRAVETGVAGKPPLTALADCRESGPPSLALLWERRALAETDLPKLVEASSRLRDDRLYESVSGVARDETQGTPKRLAALQTIAAYFEQSFAPTIEYLTQSALGDPVPRMMHRRTMVGAVPLSAGRQRDSGQLLAALVREGQDFVVSEAARRLRQAIELVSPELTPVEPGSVHLIAQCDSQVVVQSSADISLTLRVRVPGYDYTMMLKGRRWGARVR